MSEDEDDAAEMRHRQEVVAETATIRPAETRDGFIVSWNSVDLFVPMAEVKSLWMDVFWGDEEVPEADRDR